MVRVRRRLYRVEREAMNQKDLDAAEEHAKNWWNPVVLTCDLTLAEQEASFLAGCAFKEKQILELLRSEEAESGVQKKTYQFNIEKAHGSAQEWADWLEKKLGEEK